MKDYTELVADLRKSHDEGCALLEDEHTESCDCSHVCRMIAADAIKELQSENAALRRDAERWRELPAWLEKYQIEYVGLLADIDAAREKKNER